jgi:PAS domain S-box-containing protein
MSVGSGNSVSSGNSVRLLLVDGHTGLERAIGPLLRDGPFAFDVTSANGIDAAVAHLSNDPFDLALLDFRLGSGTAVDLMRTSAFLEADVPALVVTSEGGVYTDVLSAGAADCLLTNELNGVLLHRAMRYAVERHRIANERRRAEAQQAHLASIVEVSADAIFSRTLDGHILTWNAGAERIFGYTAPQAIGRHVEMLIAELDRQHLPAIFEAVGKGACVQRELQAVHLEGRTFPILVTISPTRDREGRVTGAATVARDITEQKGFQTALEESEAELNHIFNLSPDMLCTANMEGYFTRTNATWQRVLGYSEEELAQNPFLTWVHPDDKAATMAELARLSQGLETFGFTNRYRAADGNYRWIEWHSKADPKTQTIYAVARDQTERRSLELQLRQAQKMDAIGRLAGGVAHDFNNILTAITGFAEFALEQVTPGAQIEHDVREILKASNRASGLTRQLLAFSRKQMLTEELLDLGSVVDKMSAMLARIIGEDIELSIGAARGSVSSPPIAGRSSRCCST